MVQRDDLEALRENAVPQSTRKQTKWAVQRWKDWVSYRNSQESCVLEDGDAPSDLENQTDATIAYWMERFVCEARKKDTGADYPPETLYALVVSLQRNIRSVGKRPELDFFKQPQFDDLKKTLDAKMKELTEKGVATDKRKAEIITEDMEDILWEKKILGDHTPQALLDTVVFCGKEHRQLRAQPCQITIVEEPHQWPYLLYRETLSKNKPAGLKGRNQRKKEVIQHANIQNPAWCPVRLFKLYQTLCPKDQPKGAFYLKPLVSPGPDCWFSRVPVGWNQLQNTIARLCKEAGFQGFYTNHSLRATTATRLYAKGVDEQLIMERTGHSSTTAVRSYKRTTTSQLEQVSNLMFTAKNSELIVDEKENSMPCDEYLPEKKPCYEPVPIKRWSHMCELGGNVQFSGCTVTFNFKN